MQHDLAVVVSTLLLLILPGTAFVLATHEEWDHPLFIITSIFSSVEGVILLVMLVAWIVRVLNS